MEDANIFFNIAEWIFDHLYRISLYDECEEGLWSARLALGLLMLPAFAIYRFATNSELSASERKSWKLAFIAFPITSYFYVFKKEKNFFVKALTSLIAISTILVLIGLFFATMRYDGGCQHERVTPPNIHNLEFR